MQHFYILGIETSCDETGISIYKSSFGIISNKIYSQVKIHRKFGGIIPEIAAREHIKKISTLLEKVLKEVRGNVLDHLFARFENRDKAVLTELGDFYLLILDEEDFENAYLWYNVASALGVENSAEKRDKVEKELEPDKIIKIQVASRKRYEEFTEKEVIENQGQIKKTGNDYES